MEHPLFILVWRKLEPAATWRDFLVRMEDVKGRPSNGNPLSMRINRLLELFVLPYTWHGTKDFVRPTADQLRREASLSAQARANNTTRGSTPGLIDPSKGEEGGRIPYPEIPGNCEGRGDEWRTRWTLKLREMAASAKKDSSTEPSISEVDESGDQPCPELEVDYIAKFQEQYPNGRDFDNESAIPDPPYPGAELDGAFQDQDESFSLEGFVNPSKLSDHTSYAYPTYCATQKYAETNNSESFGGHSYVYDQPHPTTETDHLHQETNQFGGSDGQSYASSDRMFQDQDSQSSSSSIILDDQQVHAPHLKPSIGHHQQYAEFPDHDGQPYSARASVFQGEATLPTKAPADSGFQLHPRMNLLDVQPDPSISPFDFQPKLNYHKISYRDNTIPSIGFGVQSSRPSNRFQSFGSQSTAPIAGFETQPFRPNTSLHQFSDQVAPPVIGYGAQPLDPSTSFRSFEDSSAAPVVGLKAQPFPSNASFKPVDNHPEVVFHEFVNSHVYEAQSGLQHFQSTGSFQTFENQPATIFDEFVHADSYETESDLQSSDSQSTSSVQGYTLPQDNESESSSNTSDNQGFPTPNTAEAETPMDLDLIDEQESYSEDDESNFNEPVDQQEGSRYSPDVSMYDHHNGPYY